MSNTAKKHTNYGGRIGSKETALIHVAKNKLGMEDDSYRELLETFGVKSSKDLSGSQFSEIMECFNRAGFVSSRSLPPGEKQPVSKALLLDKIGAQLASMKLPWSYADAIALRMFKRRWVRWCTAREMEKIVAALYYRQRKLGISDEPGSHLGDVDAPQTPATSGPRDARNCQQGCRAGMSDGGAGRGEGS